MFFTFRQGLHLLRCWMAIGVGLWSVAPLWGQSASDLATWTSEQPSLTARSLGTAHVLGNLRADESALYLNPAALGLTQEVNLSLTTGINVSPIAGRYILGIGGNGVLQGGARVPLQLKAEQPLKRLVLGLSYYRTNQHAEGDFFQIDFEEDVMNRAVVAAEGTLPDDLNPLYMGVLVESGLLQHRGNGSYQSTYEGHNDLATSELTTFERVGGGHHLALSAALNYNDRWFIGLTAHLALLHDRTTFDLFEGREDNDPSINRYFSILLRESTYSRGLGGGATLGVLFQALPRWRIGLAVQSPTFYQLSNQYYLTFQTEDYSYTDTTSVEDGYLKGAERSNTYGVTTPWRLRASAGVLLGAEKQSLFGVELSYWDAGSSRLSGSSSSVDFDAVEADLRAAYTSSVGLKLGLDLYLLPFKGWLRMGYYAQTLSHHRIATEPVLRHEISVGTGWRWEHVSWDLGYRYAWGHYRYAPNVLGLTSPRVQAVDQIIWQVQSTLSVHFYVQKEPSLVLY